MIEKHRAAIASRVIRRVVLQPDVVDVERAAAAPPEADPFVLVVGPTGIDSLTVLDDTGELALIRTRGRAHFLLEHHPAPGRFAPASFARLFEDYRRHFDGLARQP